MSTPGDRVKQGQILAELDKIEIEAQVNSAKAQLLSSEANQKSAEADLKRSEVDAEGVDIPTLKRAYERATSNGQRRCCLGTPALDDAQRNYELAVNKRDVARAPARIVGKAKVAQAQARRGKRAAPPSSSLKNNSAIRPLLAPSMAWSPRAMWKSAMPLARSSYWDPVQPWS